MGLTKVCIECKTEKSLQEFYKDKTKRFGVSTWCRVCTKIHHEVYRKANRKKLRIGYKIYRKNNKKKLKARQKAYYKVNKEKVKTRWKAYREANKEKIKACRETNKEKIKAYRKVNKEKTRIYNKAYYKANRNKINAYCATYRKGRLKSDAGYRLNDIIKTAICNSLKGNKKGRHWEDIVGYTIDMLRKHLETQFAEGMTWDNYGRKGWWVDHKIPISVFNFTQPEHSDFKRCWALSNLQPMWAKENIIKSNKLVKPFQPSLLI